jgi:hypothetical protein
MLNKSRKKPRLEPPMVVPAEQAAAVFPAVRYFQIHFEFLQEQIQLILRNQEALQQNMQQLESSLSRPDPSIRADNRGMNRLERLTAVHGVAQDTESQSLNRTANR